MSTETELACEVFDPAQALRELEAVRGHLLVIASISNRLDVRTLNRFEHQMRLVHGGLASITRVVEELKRETDAKENWP